jgi:hypothetical protein
LRRRNCTKRTPPRRRPHNRFGTLLARDKPAGCQLAMSETKPRRIVPFSFVELLGDESNRTNVRWIRECIEELGTSLPMPANSSRAGWKD